jgi:hypothetical protein
MRQSRILVTNSTRSGPRVLDLAVLRTNKPIAPKPSEATPRMPEVQELELGPAQTVDWQAAC